MKKNFLSFLIFTLFFHTSNLQSKTCQSYFQTKNSVAPVIEKQLQERFLFQNAKGYSIILTVMLFSSAASSFVTSKITTDYPFMTYFISQLSVLGIVVIGAPIWEPLSSYSRNLAFRWNKERINPSSTAQSTYLEDLWHSTQQKYPINSQMSRNVLISALNNIQLNMYYAYKAFQEGESAYAILQISNMAYRLRTLFSEIPPNDIHVTLAFRSIMNIELIKNKKPDLPNEILEKISSIDPEFQKNQFYYEQLLRAWF